ncbi:Eco1p Ecym_2754 [Eremothecium cymbalariae DBVPG|uniref:N-acetyltransferase ECO1 n=1 Tax=Eremothecium cymbalariae (strain CBS 270.75 / DBVPG 7215 / KCTC 17166 / NRRL Y-17582) TaxID=931890 RepID=G8JPZ0_ERECY|nr:Hypothetical protein Ecym_2754 [Eremothecium cymbalariae DBVPG\
MITSTIDKKNRPKKSARMLQSKLILPSAPAVALHKCSGCHMTYSLNSPLDTLEHKKYHDLHLNGKKWLQSWGTIVSKFTIDKFTPPSTSSSEGSKSGSSKWENEERIVVITPGRQAEVKPMLGLMKIINDELTAPHDENSFWSEQGLDSEGRAFVYVKRGRAVGAITVEYLNEGHNRGRWMRLESRKIVPNVVPRVKLGISRIWVCKKQRGTGIATRLLDCARKHSILGMEVAKWEMAWSQPSESGGRLAKNYNSLKHSSGELLIPCYI